MVRLWKELRSCHSHLIIQIHRHIRMRGLERADALRARAEAPSVLGARYSPICPTLRFSVGLDSPWEMEPGTLAVRNRPPGDALGTAVAGARADSVRSTDALGTFRIPTRIEDPEVAKK